MSDLRPRRSVLYMPSSNDRALEKAKSIPCDALILDLEDAVAPDAKVAAREAACAAATSGDYGRREIVIRVNGADTQWHADDLAAVCAAGPDAILVPSRADRDLMGIPDEVAREVWGDSAAAAKFRRDLFSDVRMLADELGLRTPLTRWAWRLWGVDGRPARFRAEPTNAAA